ncbi:MAG: ribosome silencing factor [Parafilimonas sp.]
MEPLTVLASRRKSTVTRLNANSRIFKLILKAIQEKKGENITSLDLRKIPEAVSDYFIVCEAGSTTQIRAIADFVEETIKKELGENPYRHEGYNALHWVLIDYVNIVVHVMLRETRKFYKLEELWSDATLQEY